MLGKQEVFFSVFFYRTFSEEGGGHLEVVTELIAAGAEVSAQDEDGETALVLAVKKGKPNVEKAAPLFLCWSHLNVIQPSAAYIPVSFSSPPPSCPRMCRRCILRV